MNERETARAIRMRILECSKRANVGHIGSALSIVDLLVAVQECMRDCAIDDPDRDRLVLSKGHAALALFALLRERGVLTQHDLEGYCRDGGMLGVHPEPSVPGIDFGTGSLGQGLTIAVGAALAARLQGSSRRVFAVVSDGECNEGAVWEAAMAAGHHRLSNLVTVIDLNGQQALGHLPDVSRVENMAARWRAFGWDAVDVDGHDLDALVSAISTPADRARAVVAHTEFGHGVDFMTGRIEWHYLPMSDEQYASATRQVEHAG